MAPPEVRARAALQAAQARTGAVLATDPWPQDADRDPRRLAEEILRQRRNAAQQTKAEAEAARQQAEERRRAAGLIGRLRPSTRRELRELDAAAERAEQQADRSRVTDSDRSPAEAQAKGLAAARIAQRRRWADSRAVQDARRSDEELRLVHEAVEHRDPEVTAAAAEGDLRRARELAVEQAEQMQGYEGRLPSPGGRSPGLWR